MSLSDLASIGSLVSGLAVLASLVYLSLQIRQSHKNQRASLSQGTVNRNAEILIFLSEPYINKLTTRVEAGETNFTAEELSSLRTRLRITLLAGQDTYIQHETGLIDEITFENSLAVLKLLLAQPVYRAIWTTTRNAYAPAWVSFVEQQTKAVPLLAPSDPVAQFQKALAAVTAAPPGGHL